MKKTKEQDSALKRVESDFLERRAAIESDEDMLPQEKQSALRAAAMEYERNLRAAHEKGAA